MISMFAIVIAVATAVWCFTISMDIVYIKHLLFLITQFLHLLQPEDI